eukprot:PhM_4_TR16757/c0_g2_i1/m.26628
MKFICEDTLLERCLDWTAHNTESGHVKLSAHDHEVVSRSTDNKDTLVSVSAVHSLLLRRIRLGQLSEGQLNSPALKGIVMGLASDDPGLLERYVDALRDDPTDISNGPRGSGRVLSCRQIGKAELERYRSGGWFWHVVTNQNSVLSYQSKNRTYKQVSFSIDVPPAPFEISVLISSHNITSSDPTFAYCISFKATRGNCPELKENGVTRADTDGVWLYLHPRNVKGTSNRGVVCVFSDDFWAALNAKMKVNFFAVHFK